MFHSVHTNFCYTSLYVVYMIISSNIVISCWRTKVTSLSRYQPTTLQKSPIKWYVDILDLRHETSTLQRTRLIMQCVTTDIRPKSSKSPLLRIPCNLHWHKTHELLHKFHHEVDQLENPRTGTFVLQVVVPCTFLDDLRQGGGPGFLVSPLVYSWNILVGSHSRAMVGFFSVSISSRRPQ